MVLRPEAVRARLLRLEEVTSRLAELAPGAAGAQRSFRDDWALERGLQLGCEILFDIGNHILSAHFGVAAEDYEDVVTQLARHRVLSEGLRVRLRGLGGFRNILVHGYLRIDPERVASTSLKAPEDFSDFAEAVRSWVERQIRPES